MRYSGGGGRYRRARESDKANLVRVQYSSVYYVSVYQSAIVVVFCSLGRLQVQEQHSIYFIHKCAMLGV